MSRYIDADELWKEIESVEYYGRDAEVSRICGLIQNAPTVEVKPIIYGKWLIHKAYQGGIEEKWFQCSKCGWENALLIPRNFCPNCGTTMKKESEETK